jgi:16S rRNA processing protein RimM
LTQSSRIVLGEIIGPHGLKGELRVRFTGDAPDHLLDCEAVWIGQGASDPEARRLGVLSAGLGRGGEVRLHLEGVEGREAAARLAGSLVMAPASVLPALPEGEFYWYEMIGCRVESESGEVAGVVREVWETGAHDVLVVTDDSGHRRLIPTAAELMSRIDLESRRIVVVDLPGLFEPC